MSSVKLTSDEIGVAASALKCSTNDIKVSAPVRLYKASSKGTWEYTGSWGVAGVALNQQINAVSIQVVDLSTKAVVLNQECYKEFEYKTLSPFMHAFEGDDAVYGLNFAESFDATAFATTLKGLLSLCNAAAPPVTAKTKTVVGPSTTTSPASKQKEEKSGIGSKIFGLFGGKKTEAPKARPKISGAKNFKHVAHLGFNSKDGFGNIPPEWKSIFDKAGITEEELKDAKTAKFILKTIASAGGPPPPPPKSDSSGPPPPSSSGGPPPPPPPGPMMNAVKKAPPPPPSKNSDAPSTPQHSATLSDGGGRGDMLAQIQSGNFQLKKVTAEDIPQVDKMSEEDQNSLANKIQMAMQMRRQAVVDDDEDDEDEDWEI